LAKAPTTSIALNYMTWSEYSTAIYAKGRKDIL